jgi:hypothetical protein
LADGPLSGAGHNPKRKRENKKQGGERLQSAFQIIFLKDTDFNRKRIVFHAESSVN